MITVILDISANTHRNDPEQMQKLIHSFPKHDRKKYRVVIKTQFWGVNNPQGVNLRTSRNALLMFASYANDAGYSFSSSVFDQSALSILMQEVDYNIPFVPFVKIACREELYPLIKSVPRWMPVVVSVTKDTDLTTLATTPRDYRLLCVPEYPADVEDYEGCNANFDDNFDGYSDHTVWLNIWDRTLEWHLPLYECHYVLKRNDTNPDAGPFAKTPEDLQQMIGE